MIMCLEHSKCSLLWTLGTLPFQEDKSPGLTANSSSVAPILLLLRKRTLRTVLLATTASRDITWQASCAQLCTEQALRLSARHTARNHAERNRETAMRSHHDVQHDDA